MKRKILVNAYYEKNVGNDLFIKVLLDRYRDVDFYMLGAKDDYISLLLGITQNVGIAILNIFLTLYLSKIYGCVCSAFSIFIAYFFGNNIIMSIYYQKKANLDVISLWK